jgi:predicted PurR-regulated permease PerM
MAILSPHQQTRAFRWLVLVLSLGALATFLPLWAPLVLAVWVAAMGRPLLVRIGRAVGGRHRAAGALVVLLLMAVFVPVGGAIASLVSGVIDLGQKMLKEGSVRNALVAAVSGGEPTGIERGSNILEALTSPGKIVALLREHGAATAHIAGGIAGAATAIVLGLFVFFYAVYVFLVDGPGYYEWLETHAPFEVGHTRRLAAAFNETGRGLFVSIGLTGLAQGLVATITYVLLGVPRAFVLGLLTCLASLIPSVGTALVWVPIAIGLALAGKLGSAAIMVAVGVLVVGVIDNVTRPVFARFGKLELSNFVLLTSIFGGLALFGGGGLILGPLIARLAKEALSIARIDRLRANGGERDEGPADADDSASTDRRTPERS